MSDINDPSKARDAEAKEVAANRSDAAEATATQRSEDMVEIVSKFSSDLDSVKDELTENSQLTVTAVKSIEILKTKFARVESAIEEIRENTKSWVKFSAEVETASLFLCRCARGVDWIAAKVTGSLGKFALIVWLAYMILTSKQLPEWFGKILKAVA